MGPMPHSKIMVTGGVEPTRESLSTWFSAGAKAVGMGSQLFPSNLINEKNYQKITNIIAEMIQTYRTL
jgi:2-dehydro-3-deoxyphosphogluconate aldolase/(4S)-4-hydroxy-2-oxoglutarate aldolase